MMRRLALLAFLLAAIVHRAWNTEMTVGLDGTSSSSSFPEDDGSMSVKLLNPSNSSITIYWAGDGADGSERHIGVIPPSGSININTFTGHAFFAKRMDTDERLPYDFIAKRRSTTHTFGSGAPTVQQDDQTTNHLRVKILGVRTTAMNARFRSLTPSSVDYWYDDGGEGVYQGTLTVGKEASINTYEGHVFYFTESKNKQREVIRFVMDKDTVFYPVVDPLHPPPQDLQDLLTKHEAFDREYFQRTGLHWRHYYGFDGPRPPPSLYMWPAPNIGHNHTVVSSEGLWSCSGSKHTCQSADPLEMTLEVVGIAPRVFIIPNFLSDFEVSEIIRIAQPKIKESTVGQAEAGGVRKSGTRTSLNAWIPQATSAIIQSLYARAGHLLKVDVSTGNAEDMQVVHYVDGQRYDSHHDWGVKGGPESRLITLLLYLTDMESPDAGGETSFPKGAGGMGFKVEPKKGSAVVFYNLLEDGNGDDLALHAAMPSWGGKWLANFWVWDPMRV